VTFLFALWCAGKLGNCPAKLARKRFRFTCLYCRWRRLFYGKFVYPPFWIHYTFKAQFQITLTNCYVSDNNTTYKSQSGKQFELVSWRTLHIDPRGHFTPLRCAIIIILDNIMKTLHIEKPLTEFCEFFANYPTI